MNKIKSMLTVMALAVIAATSFGCHHTRHDDRDRRMDDPSGSSRDDRWERDRHNRGWHNDRYRDGRYDDRHHWDNPNYRR